MYVDNLIYEINIPQKLCEVNVRKYFFLAN